ncbi:MAG: glycerophosphodiester phosphodiesterase, partial [Desulfobulbus sp.]
HQTPFFLHRPPERPLIIAHRGYRACFPENTLLAFNRSVGRCDMIELDVRLSRDGEIVIFHDEFLNRTSDGANRARQLGIASLRLQDWSLSQLQQLDVGSWFLEADPFDSLGLGLVEREELGALIPQRIPRFDEVLAWSRDQQIPLNIELKDLSVEQENCRLADAVIASIKRSKVEKLILLSSFNHSLLRYCRQLEPRIARAALQEVTPPPQLCSYLLDLGVCAYHPQDAITDRGLLSELHSSGIAVNVFTVNDASRQHQLNALGVTGIITDYPGLEQGWRR